MRTVSEQQIVSMAPNANAVKNARKISTEGGFVARFRSPDDTFYRGECRGSGKSNYAVSVDFITEGQPVFRCSCPSRQFPCKHGLALMFEIMNGKSFHIEEIPADILDKRAKKEAREAKKAEQSSGDSARNVKGSEPKKLSKSSLNARRKKIEKQLEGLKLLKQLMDDLLSSGLGVMGDMSLKTYRNLAKQLGDYYLPGPLLHLNRLILEIQAYQKDSDSRHYQAAVESLIRLHAIEKKATVYLQEKLASDAVEEDDNILYEELGGVWKISQLNDLGLKKENARIVQLSFQVLYEEAGAEYIDRGYWIDVDSGEIFTTSNYRPVKALKYIKQEDSCFDLLKILVLTRYPDEINQRVRWETAEFEKVTDAVRQEIMGTAKDDYAAVVKEAKKYIKNTLTDDFMGVLLTFERIGRIVPEEQPKDAAKSEKSIEKAVYAMEDASGNQLIIRDREGWEAATDMLALLPEPDLFCKQALFGLIYYDTHDHRMCIHPMSLVTKDKIVRLLY